MKIFESKFVYELSVVLDEEEAQRIYNAYRSQKSITIPEIVWESVFIEKMEGYHFDELPYNSFHLVVRQATSNRLDLSEWKIVTGNI